MSKQNPNPTAAIIRNWAEQHAQAALEQSDPIESAKSWGRAWELSESAYRKDDNWEPREHADFLSAIENVIRERNTRALELAGRM